MHREVNLILNECLNLHLADIERILHEMNPNMVVTEETTLSLKQTVYLYEHLPKQQSTVYPHEKVEIISSKKDKQKEDKQKNKNTKPKKDNSIQEQIEFEREKYKTYKIIASCYEHAISEKEIHRCCEKLKRKAKDERILQMIKELERTYCNKIYKHLQSLNQRNSQNYCGEEIRIQTKRSHNRMQSHLTDEERRKRNGDKRRKEGYSSTGVKMATHQELVNQFVEKQNKKRSTRYERRSRAKIFISVCMGGQNKRY